MLGTVGARAQTIPEVAAYRLPQDSAKLLDEDTNMSLDPPDLGISAQQ